MLGLPSIKTIILPKGCVGVSLEDSLRSMKPSRQKHPEKTGITPVLQLYLLKYQFLGFDLTAFLQTDNKKSGFRIF